MMVGSTENVVLEWDISVIEVETGEAITQFEIGDKVFWNG